MTALGPLLGTGRQAYIYAWDEREVVKLFRSQTRLEQVEREASLTGTLSTTGLPLPRVFEVVEIDGRHGFVMSRVDGDTMMAKFAYRPWGLVGDAKLFATLHARVNTAQVSGLPLLRERIEVRIGEADTLSSDWKDKALSTLEILPDGDTVCHGDFHPDNVIMTPDGPVLIDWPAATSGAPEADLARTLVLLTTASIPPHFGRFHRWMLNAGRALFTRVYRREYSRTVGVRGEDVHNWMLPVCAARFAYDIEDDLPALRRLMSGLIAGK